MTRARDALSTARYSEAWAAGIEALGGDPASVAARLVMAETARRQGALARAAALLAEAHSLAPDVARPLRMLAELELAMGRTAEARETAHRAAALASGDAGETDALGVVLSRAGDFEGSLALFEHAAVLGPDDARHHFNLGCGRQLLGDFDGATLSFRRCLALDATVERAYVSLAEMTPQTLADNLLGPLQAGFEAALAADDSERALSLGHALAKTYEDLGDPAQALVQLDKAKALRRRRRPYDAARDRTLFEAAARSFPPGCEVGAPNFSAAPIFVVGAPRSGTTLTERILSNHHEAISIGESKAFPILMRAAAGVRSPRLDDPAVLERAAKADIGSAGEAYLRQAAALGATRLRFVDKLPFNFLYAGLIHRALPDARIVHLRRNPVDTCLSNYRTLFHTNSPFHDYAYALCDVARYYVMYDRLMAHWRRTLPADRFLELSYEALVEDQEGQTRRLLAFCGLAWDPACLSFHQNRTGVATPSALQVRHPMFKASIGRWRRYGRVLDPMRAILHEAGLAEADVAGAG